MTRKPDLEGWEPIGPAAGPGRPYRTLARAFRTLFTIVGCGGLGLLVGLAVGAYQAQAMVAALPPLPPAPTSLSEPDLRVLAIWAVRLFFGALLGFLAGLAVGIVSYTLYGIVRSVRSLGLDGSR